MKVNPRQLCSSIEPCHDWHNTYLLYLQVLNDLLLLQEILIWNFLMSYFYLQKSSSLTSSTTFALLNWRSCTPKPQRYNTFFEIDLISSFDSVAIPPAISNTDLLLFYVQMFFRTSPPPKTQSPNSSIAG